MIGDWKCSRVDDGMSKADDSAADLLWCRVLPGLAMRRIQQLVERKDCVIAILGVGPHT